MATMKVLYNDKGTLVRGTVIEMAPAYAVPSTDPDAEEGAIELVASDHATLKLSDGRIVEHASLVEGGGHGTYVIDT